MKIRAAILTGAGEKFIVDELTLDDPRAGEVRVRVKACGVCHSDWHVVTGDTRQPMPVICGHEAAGVVEAVGPGVTTPKVGDRVVLNWAPDCGECFYCRRGKQNLCETYTGPLWAGRMLDGTSRLHWRGADVFAYCGLAAFATHTVVPATAAVPFAGAVPFEVAALVGCAVATGAGAAMYTAPVRPGDNVAVIGCGGVGLCAVMGAHLAGAARVFAIDKSPARSGVAMTLGATEAVGASPLETVRAATEGRGADVVIECVGLPGLQEMGMAMTRPGGTLVLAGLSAMGTATNLPGAVLVRTEKTVKGSYYGSMWPRRDFPMLLDLYRQKRLPLDRLITRRWKLDEINEAYADLLSGAGARGVIVME